MGVAAPPWPWRSYGSPRLVLACAGSSPAIGTLYKATAEMHSRSERPIYGRPNCDNAIFECCRAAISCSKLLFARWTGILLQWSKLSGYLGDHRITFNRFRQATLGLGGRATKHDLETGSLVIGKQGDTHPDNIWKLEKLVIMRP